MGWKIFVERKVLNRLEPAKFDDETGELVAQWTANLDGLDWIETICAGDGGFALGGNGYPFIFTLSAEHLGSLLSGKIPPELRAKWRFEFHAEVASQLAEDEWLIFRVWDTS